MPFPIACMPRNYPPRSAAFVGALDATPNIVHLYCGSRLWLSAYYGNALLRLRRASDNAESDFGHDATGELDTASIATWLGGASGYITTLYDQAGSDNITQATAGAQPLYVASAQGGHAGVSYAGAQWLQGAYTVGGALSQPFSVYALAQLDASVSGLNNQYYMTDGNSGARGILCKNNALWSICAGAFLDGGAADSNWNVWAALFSGVASQYWLNGTSEAGPGNAGTNNPTGLTVGARYTGTIGWLGYITSVIVCDPSHTDAQRGVVEAALNAYWGVY